MAVRGSCSDTRHFLREAIVWEEAIAWRRPFESHFLGARSAYCTVMLALALASASASETNRVIQLAIKEKKSLRGRIDILNKLCRHIEPRHTMDTKQQTRLFRVLDIQLHEDCAYIYREKDKSNFVYMIKWN